MRAYNLIWNEWFRDENLQNSRSVFLDDGPDNDGRVTGVLAELLRRGKRHDYFTSCLPFPQKGESVTLPLGTSAPVTALGFGNTDVGVISPDQSGSLVELNNGPSNWRCRTPPNSPAGSSPARWYLSRSSVALVSH